MNKLAKGAIAGAAGIALLLGGAGTFALWNDSASVNGSSVTAGTLAFASNTTAGSWSNATATTPVPITDISTFRIVPGNTLKYTKALTVNATGNDLKGQLQLDAASITGTLASYVTTTLDATSTGATLTSAGAGTNTWNFVPNGAGTFTVNVVITVTLPATVGNGTGNGLNAQSATLNLSAVGVTLKQIAI